MSRASSPGSTSWAPTLRRSIKLFRAFRLEQTQPAVFYETLAADSTAQLAQYVDLAGKTVLDVGGGPGYFREAFQEEGTRYFALDADVGELSGLGQIASGTVIGSGMELPFVAYFFCASSDSVTIDSSPRRRLSQNSAGELAPGKRAAIPITAMALGGNESDGVVSFTRVALSFGASMRLGAQRRAGWPSRERRQRCCPPGLAQAGSSHWP